MIELAEIKKHLKQMKPQGHAVVSGGGIAGLLSARVLADYFPAVTLVEKDRLPMAPESRRGVPQSVQPHIFFARGYRILEELFPGIGLQLIQKGALKIDWAREFDYFGEQGWYANPPKPSEINSFTCSRPLFEWVIRQQLGRCSNIKILTGYRVTGLLSESSRKKVTGIRLCRGQTGIEEELPASLVVDASGRSSKAPKWLESLGLTPPPEKVINPFLGYATRRYREPKNFSENWKVMLISQAPPHQKRLGYLARIENGEWIATLGGYGQDYPPTDERGFCQFARSLSSSKFWQAITQAEPCSPIYVHRATLNRWRQFEKVEMPEGFIVLGDAVCALCPVWGQGMTVSALAAQTLLCWLRDSQNSFWGRRLSSKNFQQRLAKQIFFPWTLAITEDSRFPTTQGNTRPSGAGQIMQKYTNKLIKKATEDPALFTLLMEVGHLLKSPLALYNPSVFFKVVFQ